MQLELITHEIDNASIPQRAVDGYINASTMCSLSGKELTGYLKLSGTKAFLCELANSLNVPEDHLVFSDASGSFAERGTWVHPDVAIHLAQWCSPKFAVAVSRWVREWMTKRAKQQRFPYHIERYLANMNEVPPTHFSILTEMTLGLIGPMEKDGYTLPESLVPDISEGKMFCRWLREEKQIDTSRLPTYIHQYQDGRAVRAKLYPITLLVDFRMHFNHIWLPDRSIEYFSSRDPNALPFLKRLLLKQSALALSV